MINLLDAVYRFFDSFVFYMKGNVWTFEGYCFFSKGIVLKEINTLQTEMETLLC